MYAGVHTAVFTVLQPLLIASTSNITKEYIDTVISTIEH